MITQNTPEWKKLRKDYIGASDAPIIMGISPWKTPYQLWQEKLGLLEDDKDTFATRYGRDMEEPARRAYEEYTGHFVTPEVLFHPGKEFMMASLDGVSPDGTKAVEIKNVNLDDHMLAREGKIPEKYFPQLQHQLEILFALYGLKTIDYYSFYKGEGVIVEIGVDDKYLKQLIQKEGKFWNENVLGLKEPELTNKDFVSLEEDQEWLMLSDSWGRIHKELAELEKKEQEIRASLISRAEGKNIVGNNIKLQQVIRKGAVDYKSIPELKGVNLETYRKSPIQSWRISECG